MLAILAVLLAVPHLLGVSTPVIFPVVGLALGANAILKERRLPRRRTAQRVLGWLAVGLNGLVVVFLLVARHKR